MPGHGSKKQSQRTKGNTRPSSSSHAAQLLSASGSASTGFIGFGNLSAGPGYVPASQALDDMDSSLDSDFRMTLRKLTKRDSTTKIKALQEFSTLCKEKSDDNLKAVLPFWPRIYNKMCLDLDHRVRETAQQAMNTLVGKVGKSIAPFLKSMMGSWLLCQCDTYPTVTSAATQAFQTAFPPAKQTDALIFCKQEALEFLVDNLVNQTPASLSDPKNTESEDMQNKYNRVLTSSLLALRKLITAIPANQQKDLKEQLNCVLNDSKFWKHGKSSVIIVKGAMFSFLSGLCQSHPELCANYSAKISPFVLCSIGEKDPVISPAVWEAALSVVSHIQDCWKSVNIEKAFWPKFRSLLENGCYGNGALIGPDLLPFISRVPSDLLGQENKFYEEFFNYFKLGLTNNSVQSSASECSALIKAFMECAQYAIKQTITVKDGLFSSHILHDQILPVVQSSLFDTKSILSRSPLYTMMGSLLESLEQIETGSMDKTVIIFWTELADQIEEKMSESVLVTQQEQFMQRTTHLVKCLIYPQQAVKLKTEKVKFMGTVKENSDSQALGERTVLSNGAGLFVQRITLKAFKMAHEHWNPANLQLFAQLIELEPAEETIRKVIECCHGNVESNQSHSSYFVFEVCLPWLSNMQSSTQEGADPRQLLTVICTFLPLLEKESTVSLLQKLCESITSFCNFLHLLDKTMTRHSTMAAVQEWLHSPALGTKLVQVVETICAESVKTSSNMEDTELQYGWDILSLVLSSADENGGPVISKDIVQDILKTIHQALIKLGHSNQKNKADAAVMFVSKATRSFFLSSKDCILLQSAGDLLIALLTISLDSSYKVNCTDDTLQECENAWSSGLSCVIGLTGGFIQNQGILQKIVTLVQGKIAKTEDSDMFNLLMSNVDKILQILRNNLPGEGEEEDINPVLSTVIQKLYVTEELKLSRKLLEYIVLSSGFSFVNVPVQTYSESTGIAHILYHSLYNIKLLSTCKNIGVPSSDKKSQQVELTNDECSTYLDALCGLCVAEKWTELDKLVSKFPDLLKTKTDLETALSVVMENLTTESQNKLIQESIDRCIEKGTVWTLSLCKLLSMLSRDKEFTLDLAPLLDRCVELTENKVQLLQVCSRCLNNGDCVTLTQIMVARIISSPLDNFLDISGCIGALAVLNTLLTHLPDSELADTCNIELITSTLDLIMKLRDTEATSLLFESDVSESNQPRVFSNCEIIKYIKIVVETIPQHLNDMQWDFIMCSNVSFVQSVEESKGKLLENTPVQVFTSCCCQLLAEIADCIHFRQSIDPSKYPQNLSTEWKEFYSVSAYETILPLFITVTGNLKQTTITGTQSVILQSLAVAVSACPKEHILNHKLPPYFIAGQLSPLPDTLQTLLNHICPLLLYKDQSVQVGAFNLLKSVMSELPAFDKEDKETFSGSNTTEQSTRSPPEALMAVLKESTVAMDIMFTDIKVEECLEVQPNTEEYQFTVAYLLTWQLLLVFFRSAPAELRQEYAAHFREEGMVRQLMSYIFCLMLDNPPLTKDGESVFEKPYILSVRDEASSSCIEHIACSLYINTLKTMPAMVRQWWIEQDRKTSAYVDKFTTKHVSQLLCNAEIQSVPTMDSKLDTMSIRTRPTTREVIATYTLEEGQHRNCDMSTTKLSIRKYNSP
ncbi:hypothetical protein KUTeg_007984 [Tegillarca granosa]|uniref:E3 ubiquitin-protein ligase listerin n=1 Tax=Tegillarca granosa TaxID=220873 RepID=A0ABQ9FET7_TEGGR|nr:hypothetical protein KUTeg_007984 [Tegillarca granosa]